MYVTKSSIKEIKKVKKLFIFLYSLLVQLAHWTKSMEHWLTVVILCLILDSSDSCSLGFSLIWGRPYCRKVCQVAYQILMVFSGQSGFLYPFSVTESLGWPLNHLLKLQCNELPAHKYVVLLSPSTMNSQHICMECCCHPERFPST